MLRYLEKKLNAWIIDLLIAGTSIETENMSDDGKTFFGKLKKFFIKGLEQMQKDLNPNQKKQLKQLKQLSHLKLSQLRLPQPQWLH